MKRIEQDVREIVPGLVNAVCPLPDVVTAGQPTETELKALADAGYRTVLDLRAPDEPRGFEEADAVRRAGMEYVSVPVTPGTLDPDTFDRFRALLRDRERRPVLVHCASANRVGAFLIPYLILDEGESPEKALDTAAAVGLRSRGLAEAALRYVERKRKR